ncbi:MAG: AAA family ATPase [Pirellulaceae bacterium]
MYESFYRLSHRPFAAAPSAAAYLPTAALEQARTTLFRAIDRDEGPGLVVGPAGTGKTLVCQLLAQHFRDRFRIASLASARLGTRRALLQNILFELKLPYRGLDENELRLSLVDHLEPRSGGTDGLLLLVDEAHSLPLRLLEEIRLITNLVRDGQPRVRLVLAGGMALEERLASPKLESFHQRIAARCYLQAMGRDETIYYVQEQLRRAGGESLLNDQALRGIYTASDGIPRLVNQLCDHALMLAALGGHRQLGLAGIQEAWADLQQLPAPWHESPRTIDQAKESVIEFGQLDEASPAAATIAGPFRSQAGDSAAARLDAIESGLATLRDEASPFAASDLPREGEADEFSPADESGTEVELIFHAAHDPFGGNWEAEEVVIDRYASLEEAHLQRVGSDEGRSLGAALEAAAPHAQSTLAEFATLATVEPAPYAAQFELATTAIAPDTLAPDTIASDFDPASDPVLPDEQATLQVARRATVSLQEFAGDDRDIIVIEEDRTARSQQKPASPKRQEYRQLFSTLRKK